MSETAAPLHRCGHSFARQLTPQKSSSVGDHYDLPGLPTTFVLDALGRNVQRLVGPQTGASLDAALKAAA